MAKWYYFDKNGEKIGAVRGRELKELARQGIVTPETLVEDENGRTVLARKIQGLPFFPSGNGLQESTQESTLLIPQIGGMDSKGRCW
jgi:hypothetical protein